MRLKLIYLVALLFYVVGCRSLAQLELTYLEVWLENTADVKVSSVAIGDGKQYSDFGILGSKGAGKIAVVPIRFVSNFPIEWEENFDEMQRHATVDLTPFDGVKNRAITLYYRGHGMWAAKLGREIRPSTNAVSNVTTWGARRGDDTTDNRVATTNAVSSQSPQ